MKRLVKGEIVGAHPVKTIRNAYMVGRVATIESLEMLSFVPDITFLYQHFWQITIILNLTQIFKGRKVDGINFVSLTITEIVSCIDKSNTPLQQWISKLLSGRPGDAFVEMVRITNIAFKQNSSVRPVFLVDNIHNLAQKQTTLESKMRGLNHTLLSMIITQLTENRVLAIFAGTTAGNIDLVAEYSNFKPKYIYLKPLRVKDAYLCYTKLCEKENQERGLQIIPVKDNDPLFLAMTYESCQIPRLLKIAFSNLYNGKLQGKGDPFILHQFFHDARDYYKDALSQILYYSVQDFSKLLLYCSVNYAIQDKIPSTNLTIEELQDKSIVFPHLKSYVIPVMFWVGLTKDLTWNLKLSFDVLSKWEQVQEEIKRLVPGILFEDLLISSAKWLENAFSLHNFGCIWEKIFATSLVVKYHLTLLEKPQNSTCINFLDIYYLSKSAQAYEAVKNLKVNFSKGLITPSDEAFVSYNLDKAVYINSMIHNAHHDIVFYARPSNVSVQCKHSLTDPTRSNIALQIEQENILLWVYPGFNEDDEDPPKQCTLASVKTALKNKRLAFISGAGCISLLVVDMIIQLKQILQGVQSSSISSEENSDMEE